MKNNKPLGLFVVFDGPDGVGKTTLVKAVADRLDQDDYPVLTTREPSDGVHGHRIRQALRGEINVSTDELTELFASDRVDHLRREVFPALLDGFIVLCDRYLLSSMAYQYGVWGFWPTHIRQLNRYAPPADLMFVLDAPTKECMARIKARDETASLLETSEAQLRVRIEYENRLHWDWAARRTKCLDTRAPVPTLVETVCKEICHE